MEADQGTAGTALDAASMNTEPVALNGSVEIAPPESQNQSSRPNEQAPKRPRAVRQGPLAGRYPAVATMVMSRKLPWW